MSWVASTQTAVRFDTVGLSGPGEGLALVFVRRNCADIYRARKASHTVRPAEPGTGIRRARTCTLSTHFRCDQGAPVATSASRRVSRAPVTVPASWSTSSAWTEPKYSGGSGTVTSE